MSISHHFKKLFNTRDSFCAPTIDNNKKHRYNPKANRNTLNSFVFTTLILPLLLIKANGKYKVKETSKKISKILK